MILFYKDPNPQQVPDGDDERSNNEKKAGKDESIRRRRQNRTHTHLGVVGAVEALGEVSRLGVGHSAETADETTRDDALLAPEDADLETRVLRAFEDFVAMEAVERLGRVLARDSGIDEDGAPARVEVGEAGEVVDFCVYDDPL